jgi:hypothetical protein
MDELQRERVYKAITSAVSRILVERGLASTDFEATLKKCLEGETFSDRLGAMREKGPDHFSTTLRTLQAHVEFNRSDLPEHHQRLLRNLPALGRLFPEGSLRENPGLQVVGGLGSEFSTLTKVAEVITRLFQSKHGRAPTGDELLSRLHRARGKIRHEMAGASLPVFERFRDVVSQLGSRWNPAYFQLVGETDDFDFDPKHVANFVEKNGAWFDTKLPRNSGCPARPLGTIDLLADALEPWIVKAYELHL